MTTDQMEAVAGPYETKADKIRALNEAGASTSAISEFLEVRYQHTYNVLKRAGKVGPSQKTAVADPTFFIATLGSDGALILSDTLRDRLGAEPGDDIVCRETGEGVLIMTREAAASELQRQAAERMPEHSALLTALLGNRTASSSSERGG